MSRWSSKRRLSSAQSANSKSANIGLPLPASQTSSTPKMSSSSRSSPSSRVFSGSGSSCANFLPASFCWPPPEDSLDAAIMADRLVGSSQSRRFACHPARSFFHCCSFWLNQWDGLMSSMRMFCLRSSCHVLRYSSDSGFFSHPYRISSKPSSAVGRLTLGSICASTLGTMSGYLPIFACGHCISCSVSCTCGGGPTGSPSSASTSSAGSSSSSASSSSAGSSTAMPSSAAFLRSSSFCFFLSSFSIFFLMTSAFLLALAITFFRACSLTLALYSAPTLSCFSFSSEARRHFLNSSGGSPTSTSATLLKCGARNLASALLRNSSRRFSRTSITTRLRFCTEAAIVRFCFTWPSSNSGASKAMSGRSVEAF
mmetsp:Transcript_62549/g.168704  ORF Transcript_62549/g.168704 Transcript_62549/m.168704 type:complete len:370 (+) Transcript_62549:672-1781(+)